jgi:2-polyprenyl-3-methyl-5-hydroxy-6-metoxy-1,4-benzoquinol methylase
MPENQNSELRGLRVDLLRIGDLGAEGLARLEERKAIEAEFSDGRKARSEVDRTVDYQANEKFYTTVGRSRQYVSEWLECHVRGKVVCDYACGSGRQAVKMAKAGAAIVVGIDVSETSIETARRLAEREGVSGQCIFIQDDCEASRLPSGAFDLVVCLGVLHHMDTSNAFREIFRLLKDGGSCFAVEALDYNPFIKMYRALTPALRTDWEKDHILSLSDLKAASQLFVVREVRYWHLLSIGAVCFRRTPLFSSVLGMLNLLDSVLLRIPGVRLMAWTFTFELFKARNSR